MDNISDKLDLAIKIAGLGCCIGGFVMAYKSLKDLKSLEDNRLTPDEQVKYIFEQIDNDTDIHKESDQNNN